jgi:hypothetical protein
MKKVLTFIFLGGAFVATIASCGSSKAHCEAFTSEVITVDQENDLAQN